MESIHLKDEFIKLGQALKLAGLVGSKVCNSGRACKSKWGS